MPLPHLVGTTWGALGCPRSSTCPEPGPTITPAPSTRDSSTMQTPDGGQATQALARTAVWRWGL